MTLQYNVKIGFIGGGNMAAALIGGLADKFTPGHNIHVVDHGQETLLRLNKQFGVTTSLDINEALQECEVIVLAVKPQQTKSAVLDLVPHLRKQLILSVVTGIRAADLSRWLKGHTSIVRTMPNTPALIHHGVTGLYAMSNVLSWQRTLADTIMKAVGTTLWVDKEGLLDAVTAVSGSGPAYVFYFIEALQQAGKALGLSDQQANDLAVATFRGSSELALKLPQPVHVLREKVTSPGGTTFAALSVLDKKNVKNLIITAIQAAATRSVELGIEFGKETSKNNVEFEGDDLEFEEGELEFEEDDPTSEEKNHSEDEFEDDDSEEEALEFEEEENESEDELTRIEDNHINQRKRYSK